MSTERKSNPTEFFKIYGITMVLVFTILSVVKIHFGGHEKIESTQAMIETENEYVIQESASATIGNVLVKHVKILINNTSL